jgi:lysozyme
MNKKAGAAVAVLTAAFTCGWEGFAPVATHERVDPPNVITYCYGRTNYDEPGLKPGARCTEAEGRQFLADDLEHKYLPPLIRCISGFEDMPIQRQVAFLDAAYNLGSGRICKSFAPLLNAGRATEACDKLMEFDRANGVVLRGLQRRREAERELCLRS